MKSFYAIFCVILFLSMLLSPLFSISDHADAQQSIETTSNITAADTKPVKSIKLFSSLDEKISNIEVNDYLVGVLAAEMSPSDHEEALKAQAVAAYTFTLRRKAENSQQKYDITDDFTKDQAYKDLPSREAAWGENFNANESKLKSAVESVLGYVITYENAPILAVYHSISGGKTESSEVMWGSPYPYLVPVESIGDLLSPTYMSELVVTPDQLMSATGGEPQGDPSIWLGAEVRSPSGTVQTISIGGVSVTGVALRKSLSLRSSNFDLTYKDGNFTFKIRGYGHCVGMSQYGANYMAMQGSTFLEILSWYYPSCEMKKSL